MVGRLYVGYGEMPPAPDPNSNQYYGWVEFSRNNVDKGVYLNLSNVDIVGLPLTLKGKLADDGKPFSLGMSFAISRDCSVRLSNLNMSSKSQAMQTRSKLELLRSANETSECDNGDQRLEGASSFPL